MCGPRIPPVIAALCGVAGCLAACLTACRNPVEGRAAPAVREPVVSVSKAPLPWSAVVSDNALRFRPVLRTVAAAPGSGTDVPPTQVLQSDDPTVQQQSLRRLNCAKAADSPNVGRDLPGEPLVACDRDGTTKYLLGPAVLDGSDLLRVAVLPAVDGDGRGYVINLTFDTAGAATLANYTGSNVGRRLAFTLVYVVLSAPTIEDPIVGGETEISGNFTQEQAQQLAQRIAG